MTSIVISWRRSLNILLILSIITSFFILPAPAKAGILSSVYCSLGPLLRIAGRIGGAVAGASMASAFCPPVGTIAGAIGGWIVGGMITDYATGSLTNLAMLGCGAAGAMALGPGALGMVGGFLLGAIVGKIGMGILQTVDQKITGGLLMMKGGTAASPTAVSVSSGVTGAVTVSTQAPTTATVSADQKAKDVQAKYQAAYQNYINATQGGDAQNITAAHKAYQEAYRDYQNVLGTNPK